MTHFRTTIRIGITIAIAALSAAVASADAHAWQARFGGVQSLADHAPTIAADGRGDFFSIDDGGVVKYSGTSGAVAWRLVLDPNVDRDFSRLVALAVDADGDVIVSGALPSDDREGYFAYDAVVVKLSGANGRVLWRSEPLPSDTRRDGSATAVVVAHGGDVFLLAQLRNQSFALRLDGATGIVEWSAALTDENGVGLAARLLRADAAGRIVVAGDYPDPRLQRTTYTVAGLDPASGVVRWQWMAESASSSGPRALELADGTAVAATGVDSPGRTIDALVVALDAESGALRWQRVLDTRPYDYPSALAADPAGNVFVGGIAYEGGSGEIGAFVTALDAQGGDRWSVALPADAETPTRWLDALALADGVVLAGGRFGPANSEAGSFAALAFDAATGRRLWRIDVPHDPDVNGSSAFTGAIALAPGSVVLAGIVDTRTTLDDGILLRVATETGAEAWRTLQNDTTPTDDTGVAVVVDPNDDVVVVGTVGTPAQGADALVVKYGGGDGRELWRASIDGDFPYEIDEYASTVATDASGDVFVVARLTNADRRDGYPGLDSTIVKLDGRDGSEVWRRPFPAPDGVPLGALRVLPEGDPILVGRLDDGYDASVVRLDGRTGADVWRTSLTARGTSADTAEATTQAAGEVQPYFLEQGGSGAIIAAGTSVVTAIDAADGRIIWQVSPEPFTVAAIALDRAGDVLLAGYADGFRVVKLAATDGDEVWRGADTAARFPFGSDPVIATDAAGDVLVALNGATPLHPSLAAMKLDGNSGYTRWSRTVTGRREGRAHAAVVADGGDLVVAGWLESLAQVREFAIVRLRGSNGTTLWQRRIESRAGENAAVAVAIDGAQNVVATGSTFAPTTGQDVTTVELDVRGSSSGSDRRGDCPSLPRLPGSRTGDRASAAPSTEPCQRLAR